MIENSEHKMVKQVIEGEDNLPNVRTHEEIELLLGEIKEFEKIFPEYPIIDLKVNPEINSPGKTEEEKIKLRYRKISAIRIRRRKTKSDDTITDVPVMEKKIKEKKITPTTFNVGFDGEGNLVNLDIRKPKVKPKSESKFKKLAGLKRFRRDNKSEKTEPVSSEKMSKTSRLKAKLVKIGKLKNAIPHRGKNKEKGD